MPTGEEQEAATGVLSEASDGVPHSDHDRHGEDDNSERHDDTDTNNEVDGVDELDELLDIDNHTASCAIPDADSHVDKDGASDAGTNSQRQRMLRLGGTSQHQKQHAQQRSTEEDEDAEWAPMQLPELLTASTNVTLERFHYKKWREIHQLFVLLKAPCFRGVRLAGNDRALFETFSRAFPHDMVTKARFTSVLRSALGIQHDLGDVRANRQEEDRQVDQRQRADKLALSRHLDKLKYCYERGSDNIPMLHWRTLLIALRMFEEPLLPMREQLTWAFGVFASVNGYLELRLARKASSSSKTDPSRSTKSNGVGVVIGDVFLIFTHALRSPAAAAFVSDRLRVALSMSPLALPTLKTAHVSQQLQQMLGPSASRISRADFQALLRLPPLRSLLRHAVTGAVTTINAITKTTTTTSVILTSPQTCAMDELCSAVYRSHVSKARRREHNVRAIQRLRYYNATRVMRACFIQWATLAYRQARARARLIIVSSAIAKKRKRRAFSVMKAVCIASIAAIEIQRVFRGYRGRAAWFEQWERVQAALKVQGAFRMRAHLTRFMRDLRRQNVMAVRIQRVFRGRQGRIAARQALLALYYREMLALRLERQAFYEHIRNVMAGRIQRAMRGLLSERVAQRRREEAFARRAIEREMQENLDQAQRDLRRHRHDIAAEYERVRVEHEQGELRRKVDNLEKQKIIRRRRQREWDALRADRVARREQLKKSAEDAYSALKLEWDARIDERGRARQTLVTQLLALDDADAGNISSEWRALRVELKQRVKERAQELAAKFKAAKAVVPKQEIDERARGEVADQEAAAARQTATSEWLQAEANFLRQLDDEVEQRSLEENAQQRLARERSAVRVQSAFRMFAARKQLRDEVRARVVKEFDPRTRQAVYHNTFTGEVSARKPRALGSEELQFPDQWVVLQDAVTGDVFFYNPRSMRQSWDPPEECRMCDVCAANAAPLAFAAFWDSQAGNFVCRLCADQLLGGSTSGQLVSYDGSRRDGVTAG